ncbi:extracellular solute-binding protein [Saccharothrix australiensis]|uniref:Cellobiose-binding protein n=1 Tax=Saccharothrix australiensis TaxID=2072 RepID=A0A495W7J8_9PSEU|nr:extracellular solute-binding protein [Saccharothrix australiensis]RKT56785.1 cellobiose-binding protein [Saccharothrix australiensis]
MSGTPVGRAAAAIAIAVAATMTAACGDGAGDGAVKLSIGVFSDFGYDRLIEEYEAAHPGVRVEQRKVKMEQHHTQLATQLAGGRGAADVVAIEEGSIARFRRSKDKFVNLADHGARDLRSRWTAWKWQQGTADDGDFVLGLGTDMGGLALCYRRDLFQAAGLPVDREAVGALWPTWADFLATADRFTAATPGVKFVDTAQNVYKAVLDQTEEGYFAKDDTFIADTNPKVAEAFTLAASLGEKRQTGALTPFSQDWNVALKQGSFATTTCPAWALALIKAGAGEEAAGRWDVAAAPGGGGGNWGGSFLAVPAQSAHPREAYELAAWLTAPEQQKRIFKETGNLPSEPAAYRDPEVTSAVNDYFNQAPVGRIFGDAAESLQPTYRGTGDAQVTPVFNNALGRVESGRQSTKDSFEQAVREARDAVR